MCIFYAYKHTGCTKTGNTSCPWKEELTGFHCRNKKTSLLFSILRILYHVNVIPIQTVNLKICKNLHFT